MKRLIATLLCAGMVASTFAGCGGKEAAPAASTPATPAAPAASGAAPAATPAENAQPYKGEKIRVILGNHAWTDVVKPMLPEFTAQTGIEIVTESYPEDQLNQKVSVELTSGGKNLDVFMTRPLQETKLFIKNGWLKDITPMLSDEAFDAVDFIPSALDIFKSDDGKCYGIPLITEREILYYRKDLLEAKGIKPPTTFEELEAAAIALTDKANGQYGFVSRGLTAAAVTQFSSFLRGFGGDFIVDGKAAINAPEAVEALTFYGDMLRNYGPPGVLNMHWQQAAGVYSQGKVAMYTEADALYNSICGPEMPAVYENTGFAVMPGGKPYNITSWGLSIAAGSEKEGPAMEFIKWATSKEMMKKTQIAGNSGSRQSVWDDPESTKSMPAELVKVISDSNKIGVSSDRPVVIQVGKARDSIGLAIVAAIEGKDVQAAADKANAEFQVVIDEDFGTK